MLAADSSTTRRALLAGAAGSATALVVALTRPARLAAAAGDPVIAGQANTAGGASTLLANTSSSNHTLVVTQNGTSTAIRGDANSGTGGRFKTGGKNKFGLIASNTAGSAGTGAAIQAVGNANPGLIATTSDQPNSAAIVAINTYGTIGTTAGAAVRGYTGGGSSDDTHPAGTFYDAAGEFAGPNGVIGAATDEEGYGVLGLGASGVGVMGRSNTQSGVTGVSESGFGVFGVSTTSYSGYFSGQLYVGSHTDIAEIATPANPSANRARLFVRDNGASKTQLCVIFPTGAVQVIATQP